MRIGLMLAFVACAGCHAFGRTDRLLLDHATLAEPPLYQQVHDPTVLEKMRREKAKTVPVRSGSQVMVDFTVPDDRGAAVPDQAPASAPAAPLSTATDKPLP